MSEVEGNKKRLLTRRKAITAGAGVAVTGVIGALALEHVRNYEPRIDFSTDTVDYHFIGGAHGSSDPIRQGIVTPLKAKDVPEDTTNYQMEGGMLPYLETWVLDRMDKVYQILREDDFFTEAGKVLQDKGLPMIFTDLPPHYTEATAALSAGISAIPGVILHALGKREKTHTRRQMLLGVATGAYLLGGSRIMSGEILGTLSAAANEPWAQKIAKANHLVELSKPESLLITFRNSVIAAKSLGLEAHLPPNPQTNRPKSLLIYGSAHWGIPEYILSGKQTILEYLSLYPKYIIEKAFGVPNPHLTTSLVVTPGQDGLQLKQVVDPDLERLFNFSSR